MNLARLLLIAACIVGFPTLSKGQTTALKREQKVRADRQKVEAEGFWIYNDLKRGFSDAKASGRPLLIVLRCIPCEECVKLDDELIEGDKTIRPLLEKFVRVRVVGTNGLDLAKFQFDTDQSFAVFMLNADGTIYGRFGTRSHRTVWADDVSLAGMAKALEGALALHADYPRNKASLAGKSGSKPEFPTPESFPTLKGRFGPSLDYDGNVVKSCIHCHQIGDALREWHRSQGGRIPEDVLFPFPHPKSIGLILDPKERATVSKVAPGSPAEKAGFKPGDSVLSLNSQPLLSLADVQWVLQFASPAGATLDAEVRRGGEILKLELRLESGWRRNEDISWRASTWGLRRMALGGMLLKPATDEERRVAGLTADVMALHVEHVGQFAPHDVAKRAGFVKGDLITSFDGRSFPRETDLIAYALNSCERGRKVEVELTRDSKRLKLTLRIP